MLAREEHDADGAVPVEKGEQLGSALAVRSVERAEVVRDEAAGGLGVMCWSINAEDESRHTFGSSLRSHLNIGAMSHNCRTADHLMWLKSILALGFRRARAPRRVVWWILTPVAPAENDLFTARAPD